MTTTNEESSARKGRIAIIAGDAGQLEQILSQLTRDGHQVRGSADRAAGIRLVKEWKPELLLTSFQKPDSVESNRDETVRAVREFDKLVQVLLLGGAVGEQPARALFDEQDVYGFHHQGDGLERLLLLVDAALKHHFAISRLELQRRGLVHIVGIAAKLTRLETLDELFRVALRELRPLLGSELILKAQESGLFVFDSVTDGITIRAGSGRFAGATEISRLEATEVSALRAGLNADRPLYSGGKYVLVPMRTRERERGCLLLEAAEPSTEALMLCRMYGQQIGQAVENLGLWRRATTDGLTRLHNRGFGAERFEEIRSLDRRQSRCTSILLADIDRFKDINDRHGHAAGDLTLRAVASTMRKCGRRSDVTARWGGEEFLMVLPDTDAPSARLFAERVRAAIEALRLPFADREIRPTISIGVATAGLGDVRTPEILIGAADRALYAAKDAGRNRVHSWEPDDGGLPE